MTMDHFSPPITQLIYEFHCVKKLNPGPGALKHLVNILRVESFERAKGDHSFLSHAKRSIHYAGEKCHKCEKLFSCYMYV